jgi:hypothetical protein
MILLPTALVRNPVANLASEIPIAFADSLFGITKQLFTEKLRIYVVFFAAW